MPTKAEIAEMKTRWLSLDVTRNSYEKRATESEMAGVFGVAEGWMALAGNLTTMMFDLRREIQAAEAELGERVQVCQ